jgi:hypothetical protein
MKFPCLIKSKYCKTAIRLEIEQEGLTKYGEPLEPLIINTFCNYQDSAKTVLTAEKKLIQLSGCALIPSDIAPDLPNVTGGKITVNGVTRDVFSCQKHRNPDGTVNYTEIKVV